MSETLTIEQRAEDIVRAMVSQSWNESIETVAQQPPIRANDLLQVWRRRRPMR
jgi:hypothetical protein